MFVFQFCCRTFGCKNCFSQTSVSFSFVFKNFISAGYIQFKFGVFCSFLSVTFVQFVLQLVFFCFFSGVFSSVLSLSASTFHFLE